MHGCMALVHGQGKDAASPYPPSFRRVAPAGSVEKTKAKLSLTLLRLCQHFTRIMNRPVFDSTGLKVYGAGQWLEEKHGPVPGATGGNSIWPWMQTISALWRIP